ncbi:MAG: hypothetical protein JWL90_3801, partial [Chthoniobacteraceae bacterium]|nr:hypothetical protein [Chthoniobacteraceae bacterium]
DELIGHGKQTAVFLFAAGPRKHARGGPGAAAEIEDLFF